MCSFRFHRAARRPSKAQIRQLLFNPPESPHISSPHQRELKHTTQTQTTQSLPRQRACTCCLNLSDSAIGATICRNEGGPLCELSGNWGTQLGLLHFVSAYSLAPRTAQNRYPLLNLQKTRYYHCSQRRAARFVSSCLHEYVASNLCLRQHLYLRSLCIFGCQIIYKRWKMSQLIQQD